MNESRTSTSLKDSVTSKNWKLVKVGEIASFSSGKSISVSSLKTQSPDTPIPVYGGNGIAGYTSRSLTDNRTIVVGRVGQKCGEVHLTKGPAWVTDNALYPHRIRQRVDLGFLALALEMAGLNEIRLRNDLPLVTQPILHAAQIALPAKLEEQRAIADALSDVDALIERLDTLIAKKRAIKTATMQRLLTGNQRLPGFSAPWSKCKLATEVDLFSGQHILASNYNTNELGVPYLTGPSDFESGELAVSKWTQHPKVFAEKGDILLTVKGSGAGSIFWMDVDRAAISRQFMAIRPVSMCAKYVFFYLDSKSESLATKALGDMIPGLSRSDVLNLEIPFPSLEEQQAIATILSDMDAEIEALQARRDKTQAIKQGMMQELLTGRTRLV